MRVGLFTYGMDGQRMTGIARYAVELSRALRRLEPRPELVLLTPYPESRHPWYREFPCHPLPALRLLPTTATLGLAQLHRAAERLGLDILHDPCGIAPFLPHRTRYRRVTTVHDAIPFVYPRTQPLLTRAVFHTLVKAARRTADAVLTVSHASADDLERYARLPRQRIHVTPNGVDPPPPEDQEVTRAALARLGIDGEAPYFLYIGALHPRKNLPRILESFAALRARHAAARLVIVGPPSWGATRVLRGVLEHSGGGRGVLFTGFVSDEDLHALYRRARALVFPSLYEGFGLPVLEAMAHGTPVVTSDRSSLPEVAGDAALLVDPSSTDAIRTAMERLLDDEGLASALRERGLRRAARFSWHATAASTMAVYNEVLSS